MTFRFNSAVAVSFLLLGFLNTVCLVKWSNILDGCYTPQGVLSATASRCLAHCTAECFVNKDCEVFGYASSDKTCYLYNGSFSPAAVTPCNGTISYYTVTCGNQTGYTYVKSLKKCLSYRNASHLTWDDASEVCQYDGGHLVYVKTQETLDYIIGHKETALNKYWVGGIQSAVGSNTFEWSSGEMIDLSNGGQLWLPGRPNVGGRSERICMETRYSSSTNRDGMFDMLCNHTRKFFCEIDTF